MARRAPLTDAVLADRARAKEVAAFLRSKNYVVKVTTTSLKAFVRIFHPLDNRDKFLFWKSMENAHGWLERFYLENPGPKAAVEWGMVREGVLGELRGLVPGRIVAWTWSENRQCIYIATDRGVFDLRRDESTSYRVSAF